MTKKELGQFFTKKSDYIFQGLEKYVKGKNVFDPFAGEGDLLIWAKQKGAKTIKGADVDKRYAGGKDVFYGDSIKNPLKYQFVLTNPPYLNINKASKAIKERYFMNSKFEDLYQLSLYSIMDSEEGIVIVPINFLSAENSRKIRGIFFNKFEIVEMNYFTCQVFPDTTYNVIAFYCRKKDNPLDTKFTIKTRIYPQNKKMDIELKKDFGWAINGSFLKIIKSQKNELGIYRLTEEDVRRNHGNIEVPAAYNHVKNNIAITVSKNLYDLIKSNVILLKAIDSGTEEGKIRLENIRKYGVDCLVSKESSRHMIYFVFKNKVSIPEQEKIIEIFNREINRMRDEYSSLFLTNYRDNGRKRISFDFTYKFINYIYFNNISKNKGQRSLSLNNSKL